ncbi:MAG: 50S ribosomal protein L10 [Candidatus Aminicenantes bacterium]
MNVNRERKEQLVKEMSDAFDKYDSFYLIDFINMPVWLSVQLRKKLRENSYPFRVIKNRLALRALKEDFPEDLKTYFQGPTAIAYAEEDPVGLARLIKDFSSQHKVLTVKGGIIEGQLLQKEEFEDIAKLTSKEDLIGKLGYLMAYPLKNLLRTWQAPFNSIGSMLSQIKSKK